VVTPQEKINHFYNVFAKGIELAKDEKIENVTMIDDLTFGFDIVTNGKDKEILIKEELEKLYSDLKSSFIIDNYDEIKTILTQGNQIVTSAKVRKFKISLASLFSINVEKLFDNLDSFKEHSTQLENLFRIREQEGKLFRFINRNIVNTIKKFVMNVPNYQDFYQSNLLEETTNIATDLDKISNAINIKKVGKYYLTLDSNKIIQASYNTGGKWRSCYNIADGEYRNSALYCASHYQVGMLYSLTSTGVLKNRRLFVADKDAILMGKWYPNTPKGMINSINRTLKDLLGLESSQEGSDYSKDYDKYKTDFRLDTEYIYFDFNRDGGYSIYKNSTALKQVKNVYRNHRMNDLLDKLIGGNSMKLDTVKDKKHYFKM
jgi:hypothetical protein